MLRMPNDPRRSTGRRLASTEHLWIDERPAQSITRIDIEIELRTPCHWQSFLLQTRCRLWDQNNALRNRIQLLFLFSTARCVGRKTPQARRATQVGGRLHAADRRIADEAAVEVYVIYLLLVRRDPESAVAHFGLGVVRSVTRRLARPTQLHPGFRDDTLSLSSLHPGLSSAAPIGRLGLLGDFVAIDTMLRICKTKRVRETRSSAQPWAFQTTCSLKKLQHSP